MKRKPDPRRHLAPDQRRDALHDAGAEERLAKPASHLHLPTARDPLELILWHLIAEWGVQARTEDWQERMRASLAGFEERRTAQ